MTTAGAKPVSEKAVSLTTRQLLNHAWIDRDIGWIQFNDRVLNEALDDRNPLLERLKFLAIVSSNLDEFFMRSCVTSSVR